MEKTFKDKLNDAFASIRVREYLPVAGELKNNGATLLTNEDIRGLISSLVIRQIGAKELLITSATIRKLLLSIGTTMFEIGRAYEMNAAKEEKKG